MLRFPTIAACVLMSLEISYAQGTNGPADTLAYAVSLTKTKMCSFTPVRKDYDAKGGEKIVPADDNDREAIENLSIPIMFRPGRFLLSYEPGIELPDGTPAVVIRFSPLPKKERLKPIQDESENYVRAMNAMTGVVVIDPKTGGIFKAEGVLSEPVPAYWHGVKFGTMASTTFYYDQGKKDEVWKPSYFEAKIMFKTLFGIKTYRRTYQASFQCD